MSVQELKSEIAKQEVTPTKRFERPRDILAYVTSSTPPNKRERAIVDMCVLSVEEFDLGWHINMIDKSPTDDFEERRALIEDLNDNLKPKYVFCLTLWKARKQSRDHATGQDFIPGHEYVVSNVTGLQLYDVSGLAQGSVQARYVVKAERTSTEPEDSPDEVAEAPRAKNKPSRAGGRHSAFSNEAPPLYDPDDTAGCATPIPQSKTSDHPYTKSTRRAKDMKP